MGSSQREELVDQAIQRVLTQIDTLEVGDHNQHHLLLSSLLSQLVSLKSDDKHMEPKRLPEPEREEGTLDSCHGVAERNPRGEEKPVVAETGEKGGGSTESALVEEVVKELKQVKRQNLVTHCLLSAMILVTVVWQLSEVSLILKVQEGLSHPFKSFGSMLSGFLGGKKMVNLQQELEKHQSSSKNQTGDIVSPVPPLNMPELPHVEWGINGKN